MPAEWQRLAKTGPAEELPSQRPHRHLIRKLRHYATKDQSSCRLSSAQCHACRRVDLCKLRSLTFPHLASPAGLASAFLKGSCWVLLARMTRCPRVGQSQGAGPARSVRCTALCRGRIAEQAQEGAFPAAGCSQEPGCACKGAPITHTRMRAPTDPLTKQHAILSLTCKDTLPSQLAPGLWIHRPRQGEGERGRRSSPREPLHAGLRATEVQVL